MAHPLCVWGAKICDNAFHKAPHDTLLKSESMLRHKANFLEDVDSIWLFQGRPRLGPGFIKLRFGIFGFCVDKWN